ncbi:MAG: hypothetical protein ACYC4L_21290 [Chloroflexota bacterium]
MRRQNIALFFLLAIAAAALVFLSQPPPVAAQCGSSTSSCKDCHEVKKQAPVNAKGAWHTGHAFGDFCEFCHGGNVKAKEQATAHVGLTAPLADVKASCQSCHASDYADRGQIYATALGLTVGTGGPAAGAPAAGSGAAVSGDCGPAVPTGGQGIDLNKVYAETLSPRSFNPGNSVLLGMIAAVLLLLFGLVWYYENPLVRAVAGVRALLATPSLPGASAGAATPDVAGRPDIGALLPLLAASDQETVRGISHLLADRENGPKLVRALSNLDLRALAALGEGDERTLAALLALAREMHA